MKYHSQIEAEADIERLELKSRLTKLKAKAKRIKDVLDRRDGKKESNYVHHIKRVGAV